MDFRVLAAGASIVLVDLVLSGDNALVIGAAASRLPRRQQTVAIIWGGVGAFLLRFALAAVATELLRIPFLQALGALIVLAVAVRILLPDEVGGSRWRRSSDRMLRAILTIVVADVSMSLDNVLAVGALAAGRVLLLAGGLAVSILALFVASAVVTVIIRRLWWLLDLAALVLGWTAAQMLVNDPWLQGWIVRLDVASRVRMVLPLAVYALCLLVVVIADLVLRLVPRRRDAHRERSVRAARMAEDAGVPTSPMLPAAPAEPLSPNGTAAPVSTPAEKQHPLEP
jgi:YjbE family integral membrane protein